MDQFRYDRVRVATQNHINSIHSSGDIAVLLESGTGDCSGMSQQHNQINFFFLSQFFYAIFGGFNRIGESESLNWRILNGFIAH